ncbi:MFS transporter [Nocardiopsis nanhaiensis]
MSSFRAPFTWRPDGSPSLGPDFLRLWWSAALTNLGGGSLLAAGPLLVAALTDSAAVVAGAAFVQMLPTLLFSLTSGALVDRWSRRAVLVSANLARAIVLAVLAAVLLAGVPPVWVLYAALFVLGVAETLAAPAYGAMVVSVVPRALLGRANARLALTFSLNNQLLGPPLGALMFGAAWAFPFGFDAIAHVMAALLVLRIAVPPVPKPETGGKAGDGQRTALRSAVRDGLAYVWQTSALRTLCACILVMNLTGVGAFAIWVVYAQERLGLSDTQFGLFISAGALGGLVGSAVFEWLEPRLGLVFLLRWGLVVEALTYAALALASNGIVAGAVMVLFGVHTMVWGTAAVTVRQRATPDRLLGRVGSVYRWTDIGGAALGALLGGILAEHVGLLAPFWLAAASVGALTLAVWRPLGVARPL